MLIADTFTVHRETGKQNSKSAPVPYLALKGPNSQWLTVSNPWFIQIH